MPSMLARSINLTIRGEPQKVKTPLLIPSFSSKASVDITTIFEALRTSITETLLVSAYDIFYGKIELPVIAPAEVLFLDSGGYEVSKDYDIMDPQYADPGYPPPNQRGWDLEKHQQILEGIDPIIPTIATAFDHPDQRRSIPHQIDAALETFKHYSQLGREILIKPEAPDEEFVGISRLVAEVSRFREFDVIGITESELGKSVLDRMANIARIRSAMALEGVTKPLHIFGSLDPVCTPLYFLAGADIFDGLSWLRFSYWKDLAVYHRNRAPLEYGTGEREQRGLVRAYSANLYYLEELKQRFDRYLLDGDKEQLGTHSVLFAKSLDDLRVKLKGVV